MVSMMNTDHWIALLVQWVDNPQHPDLPSIAVILSKLRTALGGSQQLHDFLYNNNHYPFLGTNFLSKFTHLLKHNLISLQRYMEEMANGAGYDNVISYEEAEPNVTRSKNYGFGETNDQKGNDNGIQLPKELGNAFAALSKKAKQAATATGKNKKCGQSIFTFCCYHTPCSINY